jgi:hypothetical protein
LAGSGALAGALEGSAGLIGNLAEIGSGFGLSLGDHHGADCKYPPNNQSRISIDVFILEKAKSQVFIEKS